MKRDLRSYLQFLEEELPSQIVYVDKVVDPSKFEVTAILQNLENLGKYPLVVFSKPLNLKGEISEFPIVTNVFASRDRCAVALGLSPSESLLPLSLEYSRREAKRLPPVVVSKDAAPVKDAIHTGEAVDLTAFPIVRHHRMDPAPYIDMAPVLRDPEGGFYNSSFQRTMFVGPRKILIAMGPFHNWRIFRKYEERGRPAPVAVVVSHHPAFYLGALNVAPFGTDDYEVIGSMMGEPLRLTPSETWGNNFLVPADAEIIIEGEILPDVQEIEAPFGEFTGYYGPQTLAQVINVTAVTHRKDAIYQDTFVGHRDNWILGSIPKEGSLFNRVKGVVPTAKAMHIPNSGTGRYNCYLSIDKRVDGESKQAALIVLGDCDFIKNVIVVDADIDPFNEEQVLWAVATRVQADEDIEILKGVKGNPLDPSQTDPFMTAKLIIDATRPLNRPFEVRIDVPGPALERMRLEEYLPAGVLDRLR